MQEAFFFGPDDRQLFAVYHPSASMGARVLTVICPPLFAELNRTHSLLQRLAQSLSERGQHILRLDYSGTGDSFGRLDDASLEDWERDIVLAIEEGRDLSGCRTIRLLGVRGSAPLVCRAAGGQKGIDKIVLWDPIPGGAAYLKSLLRQQESMLEHHHPVSNVRPNAGRISVARIRCLFGRGDRESPCCGHNAGSVLAFARRFNESRPDNL